MPPWETDFDSKFEMDNNNIKYKDESWTWDDMIHDHVDYVSYNHAIPNLTLLLKLLRRVKNVI